MPALDRKGSRAGPGEEESGQGVFAGIGFLILVGPILEELIGGVFGGQSPDCPAETSAKSRGCSCAESSGGLSEEDGVGHLIAEQRFSELLRAVDLAGVFVLVLVTKSVAGGGDNLLVLGEEMFEALEELLGGEVAVMGAAK